MKFLSLGILLGLEYIFQAQCFTFAPPLKAPAYKKGCGTYGCTAPLGAIPQPGIHLDTDSDPNTDLGIIFQYSPSSLRHLEAVELPPKVDRPWTKEKIFAITGAFLLGGLSFALGGSIGNALWGDDQAGILMGGVGTAGGWYLCGGGAVMESEKPKNGGYDAKLIADRPARLKCILDDFSSSSENWMVRVRTEDSEENSNATKYATMVHGEDYLQSLKHKCEQTRVPTRFNPTYARTLIDQFSYNSALNAVQDWIDSVDAALDTNSKPKFALVRPPGHHACKAKGMGGCLLNGAAIAAFYALDQYPNVKNVAILDVDAHHGNGIAHCVEDNPNIRYCSIHEAKGEGKMWVEQKVPKDDPRTQDSEDTGSLGNLCNINLKAGTGWKNGYRDALLGTALPFLLENSPDLLICSAGFDALENDWSSNLMLKPADYNLIGCELYEVFGDTVAMGLEGGYSFQDHALSNALMEFSRAWKKDI